jgi:hypothetical protein
MLLLIYNFIKFTSNILVLAGLSCLFNHLYYIAFLMFFSFAVIKLVDSDWSFKTLKSKNHNGLVVMVTIVLLFINIAIIYKNMQNNPIFIRATEAQKADYLSYENQLFDKLRQCSDSHNQLLLKKAHSEIISEDEAKASNLLCVNTMSQIEEIKIPYGKVPAETISPISDMKNDFRYIALGLSNYDYLKDDGSNDNGSSLLKSNLAQAFSLIEQTRTMLNITEKIENNKQNIVNLN